MTAPTRSPRNRTITALAVFVAAVVLGGIAVAIVRPGDLDDDEGAGPTTTAAVETTTTAARDTTTTAGGDTTTTTATGEVTTTTAGGDTTTTAAGDTTTTEEATTTTMAASTTTTTPGSGLGTGGASGVDQSTADTGAESMLWLGLLLATIGIVARHARVLGARSRLVDGYPAQNRHR